ncbi:MAG: hypothetical protein CM15mP68_0380 [Pseudomonadota bacterium]|nr:MAG: hypothetical protein CM15mP68_0380 [Pseudomonadota bacterium]
MVRTLISPALLQARESALGLFQIEPGHKKRPPKWREVPLPRCHYRETQTPLLHFPLFKPKRICWPFVVSQWAIKKNQK